MLVPFALGLCLTRALRGATWAGARVFLEPNAPLEIPSPTICIYCGHGRSVAVGHDLLTANYGLRLRLEIFLPVSVDVDIGGVARRFDTDASLAFVFAMIGRQIDNVIATAATPAGQPAFIEVWRALVMRTTFVETQSDLFQTDKGAKIGARILEYTIDPVSEPQPGVAASGVWADLLVAMRAADTELSALADILATAIEGAALSDSAQILARLGLSVSMAPALGVGESLDDVDNMDAPVGDEQPVPLTPDDLAVVGVAP